MDIIRDIFAYFMATVLIIGALIWVFSSPLTFIAFFILTGIVVGIIVGSFSK